MMRRLKGYVQAREISHGDFASRRVAGLAGADGDEAPGAFDALEFGLALLGEGYS
jgi:hypothetical protein